MVDCETFSYPTYMVGGSSLGIVGRFFPTYTQAKPMRTNRNGRGIVDRYYQPGAHPLPLSTF